MTTKQWTKENSAVIRAVNELKNDPVFKSIEFTDFNPAESVHLLPERVSGTVTADVVVDGVSGSVGLHIPPAWHDDIANDATVRTLLRHHLVNAFHDGRGQDDKQRQTRL